VTTSRIGRAWHALTLLVAVLALVLQLYLVISGENILDSSAVATARPEQVRRSFSYFTIQSSILVAVSMFFIVRDRLDTQVFRVVRLASLIGITVTGIVAFVAPPTLADLHHGKPRLRPSAPRRRALADLGRVGGLRSPPQGQP
jgi:hypothetical protein